jgi:ABC-2 type transport system permease protein
MKTRPGRIKAMDVPATIKPVRINRWLPYWAVLQADVHQTLRSWVYRTWVLVSVASAAGFVIYHAGVSREAGIVLNASKLISDLLRWTMLGSVTLVIVLTASCISSERGTMADSVLSRGISRYQYFFGKWHARLFSVLTTFLILGSTTLLSSYLLLADDLSVAGCLAALLTVAALLTAVVSCGVAVSALVNSSVLGISIIWLAIYGSGFVLSLLPTYLPSPGRTVANLGSILRGYYDVQALLRLAGWSLAVSVGMAVVGSIGFARRDV